MINELPDIWRQRATHLRVRSGTPQQEAQNKLAAKFLDDAANELTALLPWLPRAEDDGGDTTDPVPEPEPVVPAKKSRTKKTEETTD